MFERGDRRARLIAWRNRVAKVLFFIDNNILKIAAVVVLWAIFFSTLYLFYWRAPKPFPEHALITVERGEPLSQIADSFKQKGIVRSGFWLRALITLWGGEKKVIAGDYYFPQSESVFGVLKMLTYGKFGLIPIKVTIQEGLSAREMAVTLSESLPAFNSEEFIEAVNEANLEGYLFPDTYFFMPNTRANDVILTMRENFERQIQQYQEDILKFEKPLNEVIIMASIIEDESSGSIASKRIVSGILWKRIRLKMPLQVDAPFQYYNGKNSYTLTKDDLKEDHPYNTYLNKGLPPTAINNPGLDSIRAAITPTPTEYLYFSSDKKGNMYYAKDFDGHKLNRELHNI